MKWRSVLADVARFGVFLLLWQLVALALDSAFLPPLGEVFTAFADSFIFERIWSDVVPSIGRMAAGYTIAAVVGISAGLLIGSNWVVRRTAGPVTEFLRAIPPPALLPFAMLVFGFGLSMKVFVISDRMCVADPAQYGGRGPRRRPHVQRGGPCLQAR